MRKKAGFTLIELLVVVSVIAVLVAILMPALGRARDLARKSTCASQMRQYGNAIASYMGAYHSYPHFAIRLASYPYPPGGFTINRPNSNRSWPFPKFYAVLEQMGLKGTDRTTWGVQAYLWEPDEIWDGALCPAMDAMAMHKWCDEALAGALSPQHKVFEHRAAIGYAWNMTLRAKTPQFHNSYYNVLVEGRWPPQLQGMPDADANDNTQWIWWCIVPPDGKTYGAQAINLDEVDTPGQVAEAWDSNDLDTAPGFDFTGQFRVENLMPGANWGPEMEYANGMALLNGARHPGSPNILYADGSVRADATRKVKPSELAGPLAGISGIKVNTWADNGATAKGMALGTLHHIVPQRKLWRP